MRSTSPESPLPVSQRRSAFHPHAQRTRAKRERKRAGGLWGEFACHSKQSRPADKKMGRRKFWAAGFNAPAKICGRVPPSHARLRVTAGLFSGRSGRRSLAPSQLGVFASLSVCGNRFFNDGPIRWRLSASSRSPIACRHVYEVRPRKDRRGVRCGYKGQRVGSRYRSVNKFHTAKPTHAGLS